MEFMKLEKIEFGGIKGKMLSSQVVQIFDEFNELYKVFTERSYDSLDPLDEVCRVPIGKFLVTLCSSDY